MFIYLHSKSHKPDIYHNTLLYYPAYYQNIKQHNPKMLKVLNFTGPKALNLSVHVRKIVLRSISGKRVGFNVQWNPKFVWIFTFLHLFSKLELGACHKCVISGTMG